MDQIVDLVLKPIGMFSGKPLAVGIALSILGSALVLWLLISVLWERRFLHQYWRMTRAVRAARAEASTQEDALARIDEEFQASAHASGWRQYRSSVEFANGDVLSYTDPAPFFAAERLPGHNYVKWSPTLGGVFLTVGLFFTFVGLSAALLQVGGDGHSTMEPTQLRKAVEGILGVSSVKFITSIAGILAYIGWSIVARVQADRQDKAVEHLISEIRHLSAYVSPEMLLRNQLKAIEAQHQQFQTFGSDLAVAIGNQIELSLKSRLDALPQAVADSIGPAVAGAIAPVRDDLLAIGSQIGKAGGALADGAGDVFSRVWQDGIGNHMVMFGEQMTRTIASLESLPEKVRQTETGLGGEIGRAAAKLSETATRLSATFDQGQRSVTMALESFNDKVAGIPDIIEKASRDSAEKVGRSVEASLEGISNVTAKAGQATAEQLAAAVSQISTALATSAEGLRAAGDHSANGLKSARDDLAAGVRDGIKIITETAGDASAKLSETVAALASVVNGLATRLDRTTQLLEAQQDHLVRAGELVSGASTTLAKAAGNVESATLPLTSVVRNVNSALEQVGSATETVRAATVSGQRMAELLSMAADKAQITVTEQADRFDELHTNVRGTLNELLQGVSQLGKDISVCMETYDREISQSISSLETAMLDVADIVDQRRPVPSVHAVSA
jgi:hypothetical protein